MAAHRQPRDLPVNTGPGCCPGCQTVPGREHGFACPDAPRQRGLADYARRLHIRIRPSDNPHGGTR